MVEGFLVVFLISAAFKKISEHFDFAVYLHRTRKPEHRQGDWCHKLSAGRLRGDFLNFFLLRLVKKKEKKKTFLEGEERTCGRKAFLSPLNWIKSWRKWRVLPPPSPLLPLHLALNFLPTGRR